MRTNTKQYAVCAGLLLCSAAVASANTLVTFQVDMSNAGIDPYTQTVSAHGSFNGWGSGFALTNNPSGSTPYIFSGTANVAANGTVMEYKYVIDPGTWETIPKGNNRLATLATTSGASLVLPMVYYADNPPAAITVDVTFKVDMAQQINVGAFDPNSVSVYARGTWNGWGTPDVMTNDPTILRTNQNGLVTSNVFVCTASVTGSPGETMDFKYCIGIGNTGYESPAAGTGDPSDHNNRFFNLSDGPPQTMPIVLFSDAPYAPVATNDVTFQVDMTAQVLNGSFDPATGTVSVPGDFNGWDTTQNLCTNDPTALNTNLYTAVVRIVNGVGATEGYKFWASGLPNSGWETTPNRTFQLVSGTSQVLPVVFFNNVDPANLLPEDTLVTFTINMTNAVGTDAHVFNPSTDQVYINGDFYNNWNGGVWDTGLPQLTNNPVGSGLYSIQLLVPKGNSVSLTYKFSINGPDNEAPSGQNHFRYVRTAGAYTLPLDKFGNQYAEPYSFGELAAGTASAGRVQVSWLGRPGVYLQTKADLSSGAWQTLLNTDGSGWSNGLMSTNGFVSVTNYPTSAGKTFFRLINP
jgi:hypothetical protein